MLLLVGGGGGARSNYWQLVPWLGGEMDRSLELEEDRRSSSRLMIMMMTAAVVVVVVDCWTPFFHGRRPK
jgi:hypothetical protein